MKIIAKTLLTASLCMLAAVPAHAGRYHDDSRLMDRMERQHERIQSGIESGALTRKEAGKLKKQQRKNRSMVRKFREDDVLSRKERRILGRRLDKTSDRIREYRHNDSYRHTDRYAFRDTYRDEHRHHRHDDRYEDDGGIVYWLSDAEAWPRYGLLVW